MPKLENIRFLKLPLALSGLYLWLVGLLLHCFPSVGGCEWSSWAECPTYCGGSEIQHRVRNCGNCTQKCNPTDIESRRCNNTECHEFSDSKELSMTSAGTTQSVLNVTDMTAAKVLSTPNGYHEENFTTTDDSAKDFQLNKFDPTANTTQNNLTTKIITIMKLSTDVKNVTEDIVSLPTAALTPKACLHSTGEEENIAFRYIRELFIAILVFLLVLVFAAFLCERKKRLKQQREHSYIFTLPPNTELNNIRESNVFYHTTLDFSNLFIDDRAERLSSCIYQDITDLIPLDNLVSSRSTYQQIPVNHVNTEDVQ